MFKFLNQMTIRPLRLIFGIQGMECPLIKDIIGRGSISLLLASNLTKP
mgnify:CR=1 FL=1